MVAKKRKPKVRAKNTRLSAKERKKLDKRLSSRYEALRKQYPEVHGKVVDFISHTIEEGMLFFTVRFTDKTVFSLRYRCDLVAVGADLGDLKTGDLKMIREYIRPNS